MAGITHGSRHPVRAGACCLLLALSGCGSTAQSGPSDGAGGGRAAASSQEEVVAVVNGESITSGDVQQALGATLAKLEEQAYALKKQQVDELIGAKLLAAEAQRRGVTVDALVQQEILARVAPITEADVSAFVTANRTRIQGDPATLSPQIRNYLTVQREQVRRDEFIRSLRASADVEVRLKAPPLYRAPVRTIGAPARGAADAAVTIVEFSDFHCPYCRAVQPTLNRLLEKYSGKLRLLYRHMPLDNLHPQARRAAEASWCAAEQDKFWQYHDRLYKGGADASDATLRRFATEAALDMAAFDACRASGRAKGPVQEDVDEGSRYGVNGTPGFFVNGRLLAGNQPLEAFVSVIDEELNERR